MSKKKLCIFSGDPYQQFPSVTISERVRQAFAIHLNNQPTPYRDFVASTGLCINLSNCVEIIDQAEAGQGLIATKPILNNSVIAGYGGLCDFSTAEQSHRSDYRNTLFTGELQAQIDLEIDQTGDKNISDLIKQGDQNYLNYVWVTYTAQQKTMTYIGESAIVSHDISDLALDFSNQATLAEQILAFCRLQRMPYLLLNLNGKHTQGIADKVQHGTEANTMIKFSKTRFGFSLPILMTCRDIKAGEFILRDYGARYVRHFEARTGKKMLVWI